VTDSPAEPSADRAGMRVLLAGESWVQHVTHIKGFDTFTTSDYTEGATYFIASMRAAGHELTYVPCHEIPSRFPRTAAELRGYDVVILSDVGSNTFLLTPQTFVRSEIAPNVLSALADYVLHGGGLLMIGGYMSFTGIEGRARYGATPLAPVLPVDLLDRDDRVEVPEGFVAEVTATEHPALGAVDRDWPRLLGYNRLRPRPDSTVLATHGEDPILTVGHCGDGRAAAFASDLAPHWAPPEFVEWSGYAQLWDSVLRWLGTADPGGR
jgi:uncharacterized membrane protein